MNNIVALAAAASFALTPAPSMIDVTVTIPPASTYENAVLSCHTIDDVDESANCLDAARNTDWAPASTAFVLHTLATNAEIVIAVADTDRELRDAALEFDTTYEFERDTLVCELAFPTMYEPTDDRYITDPTTFALEACIDDTISNHRMID